MRPDNQKHVNPKTLLSLSKMKLIYQLFNIVIDPNLFKSSTASNIGGPNLQLGFVLRTTICCLFCSIVSNESWYTVYAILLCQFTAHSYMAAVLCYLEVLQPNFSSSMGEGDFHPLRQNMGSNPAIRLLNFATALELAQNQGCLCKHGYSGSRFLSLHQISNKQSYIWTNWITYTGNLTRWIAVRALIIWKCFLVIPWQH